MSVAARVLRKTQRMVMAMVERGRQPHGERASLRCAGACRTHRHIPAIGQQTCRVLDRHSSSSPSRGPRSSPPPNTIIRKASTRRARWEAKVLGLCRKQCPQHGRKSWPEGRHGLTAGQAGGFGAAGLGALGQQPRDQCPAGPGTGELGCSSGRWRAGGDAGPSGGKDGLWEPATAKEWGWVGDGLGERRDRDRAVFWPRGQGSPILHAPGWICLRGWAGTCCVYPLVAEAACPGQL